MTKQTIIALYDNHRDALQAARRLKTCLFPKEDIALVGGGEEMRASAAAERGGDDEARAVISGAAAAGGTVGAGAGFLAGLGLLPIPGMGSVVAIGWLVSMLLGAGLGVAAGGLVGALIAAGVPEEEAHAYAEGVRRGGTLVVARVDPRRAKRARAILRNQRGVNMAERAARWRQEGWNGRHARGRGDHAMPSCSASDAKNAR